MQHVSDALLVLAAAHFIVALSFMFYQYVRDCHPSMIKGLLLKLQDISVARQRVKTAEHYAKQIDLIDKILNSKRLHVALRRENIVLDFDGTNDSDQLNALVDLMYKMREQYAFKLEAL